MTGSFETRMTCADNISAVQHEKCACRVKRTLCTQGQEATTTNGTTLSGSRGKNDLRTAWIYPRPRDRLLHHVGRFRSIPHGVVGVILPHPVRRSTCSYQASLCSNSHTFPRIVPGPVPGTSSRPDQSASLARDPVGV